MSTVLLGIGGGIAAYKLAFVASRLVQAGHRVRVALSRSAVDFIGAATFEGLTGTKAILSSTQIDPDGNPPHIAATREAQVLLVAPATADLLGKLAAGVADDPVCLAAIACRCPRLLAPAMNDAMWESSAVRASLRRCEELGFRIVGPVVGHLAEGYDAIGRMVEPEQLVAAIVGELAELTPAAKLRKR